MTDTIWTVVENCDGEITTWQRSFRSYEAAAAVIRENAKNMAGDWGSEKRAEYLGDEPDGTHVFALVDGDDLDGFVEVIWRVTETTPEG